MWGWWSDAVRDQRGGSRGSLRSFHEPRSGRRGDVTFRCSRSLVGTQWSRADPANRGLGVGSGRTTASPAPIAGGGAAATRRGGGGTGRRRATGGRTGRRPGSAGPLSRTSPSASGGAPGRAVRGREWSWRTRSASVGTCIRLRSRCVTRAERDVFRRPLRARSPGVGGGERRGHA